MRRVRIIGIGPGHPDQVTVEAVRAMNNVDVFVVADKSGSDRNDELVRLREEICARHITGDYRIVRVRDPERDRSASVDTADGYGAAVDDWHHARAVAYRDVLSTLGADETAGFLVWGDPAFYDSTIRIVQRVLALGDVAFEYDVIPGISAIQLLAARHRLVLNEIGSSITITTGRRLRDAVDAGLDNLVVVLNRRPVPRDLPGSWDIWWGANLGTVDEILIAGSVEDLTDDIEAARTRLKDERGWVMDTYVLRRREDPVS